MPLKETASNDFLNLLYIRQSLFVFLMACDIFYTEYEVNRIYNWFTRTFKISITLNPYNENVFNTFQHFEVPQRR